MAAWLAATWSQLWPNLLANAVWVLAAALWARSRLRRDAVEHRAQVEHLLREHRQELHLYLGDRPGRG